jgi:tetratricopeptide (TPR) repeat protein/tRNA A-37 threonylcarbamoyl transferase component Bud32
MVVRDCKILSILGEGGMGAVYKARHVQLGTYRAIKVIRKELANQPGFYERFRNEALLAEELTHPNLVKLYDFSRLDDGSLYTIWEFVEGETLESVLKKKGPFEPAEAVHVVRDVLSGLTAAHHHGVIHRDIALDNIMLVTGEGGRRRVKLLDFGIAKSLRMAETSRVTEVGVFVGKVGYSSPEQVGGLKDGEELDFRTDMFSLGVVLFRMLTAKFPFESGNLTAFLRDIITATPDRIRQKLPPAIPVDLQDFIVRCLASKREERFRSDEEMQEALDAINLERPAATGPQALAATVLSRHRGLRRALGVLVLALLASMALLLHRNGIVDLSALGFPPVEGAVGGNARTWRQSSEAAFASRRYVEPSEDNAMHWARRVTEAEQNTVFFDGMKGRVVERLTQESAAYLGSRNLADLERARKGFSQALSLAPDSAEARFGHLLAGAGVEILSGNYERGLAMLEEARALNPAAPEIRLWMAEAHRGLSNRYAEAGDFGKAREHRDQALLLNPSFGPGDFRLASLESEAQTRQRQEQVAKAAVPKPSLPPPPRAEPSKLKAEPVQPIASSLPRLQGARDPNLLNNEATALSNQKRFVEANAKFEEALAAAPDNPVIRLNYAHNLFRQKEYGAAERQYRQVLEKKPGEAEAQYYLGRIALEQDRPVEAENFLRKAVAAQPARAGWRFDLAKALEDLKRYAEAEQEYLQARSLGLDDFYVHFNLGNIYWSLGRHEDSIASFRRALEKQPGSLSARFSLAQVLVETRRGAEAMQEFEACLQADPNHAGAWSQVGTLHYNAGRYAEARDAYMKVVSLKPANGTAHFNLSQAYAALGEAAMAKIHREKACALGVAQACREGTEKSG